MPTSRHIVRRSSSDSSPGVPLSFSDFDLLEEEASLSLSFVKYPHTSSSGLSNVCPEVSLMYAVLQDAIHCFQGLSMRNPRDAQRLAREAAEWFFSEDIDWPFSFLNICEVLRLDPSYIRSGLKRWQQCPPTERQKKRRRFSALARRPLKAAA
jgi:hypothetical protein